ncbi:MFS transporter [Acerihabitans sp. KWT182]|uniref:MFS transporter n=1 Tax=Acerihabitans sp. KWT182 TaxID=3157919 RepID=A0AAU7Q9Z6_9GAMM
MKRNESCDNPSFRISVANKILVLLCILYFLLYIDRVNLSVAAGSIKSEFHLNTLQVGMAFSAFGYGYVVFQIIGGWIGDRIGPRRTLGFFFCSFGVVSPLASALPTVWRL